MGNTNEGLVKNNEVQSFAKDDDDAKLRYSQFGKVDPFPSIPPSLLNSADIYKYVHKTGMLYPFYPDLLKGATYPVKIGSSCTYWDDKGIMQNVNLKDGKSFLLEKNAIVFVELEPNFRVPDYMVLRFNLKIKHIYKGLLLGTGPIVDPGFHGKLYIPLHNLTRNAYEFRGGEELIYMEFTKLSPNLIWQGTEQVGVSGKYIPFPEAKFERPVIQYIQDALQGYIPNSNDVIIKNSIPEELRSIKTIVDQSKKDSNAAIKKVNGILKFGIAAAVIAIITLFVALYQMFISVDDLINSVYSRLDNVSIESKSISKDNNTLMEENKKLKEEIDLLNCKIKALAEESKKESENNETAN